jgi:methyltransferase
VTAVIAFVGAAMIGALLAETRVSRGNERTLRARGALVPPGDVYAAMAIVYPASFLAMAAEGVWRSSNAAGTASDEPNWFVSGVLLFVASKALKYWAIRTLGERWTFRVMVLPGVPLVRSGPYRYIDHPNYVAVAGELAGAAMMCGARISGPIALVVFGALLWARVRFESAALQAARSTEER